VIELLILNGIPTRIICDLLKLEPNSVQYHLRWLEANGKIIRPSKTANWETARAT
jgi:DNA-binding CsgD family transcriptional regulator